MRDHRPYPDPKLYQQNRLQGAEYSITATTHYPGQDPHIEFFDSEGLPIGEVKSFNGGDGLTAPRDVVIPGSLNTEQQHRALDKAVDKLRELRSRSRSMTRLEYTPITVHEMDLVEVAKGLSPERAKQVLEILLRTLEETFKPERTKEKK